MRDKKNRAQPDSKSAASVIYGATPRRARFEIVNTIQLKTQTGAWVSWTGYRATAAQPSEPPDFYACTLPRNATGGRPSSYSLRGIAAQGGQNELKLIAVDRDVVYFITAPGTGKVARRPVARGRIFVVPPRVGPGENGVTAVKLTFHGADCTLKAVLVRKPRLPPDKGDDSPPLPLPPP